MILLFYIKIIIASLECTCMLSFFSSKVDTCQKVSHEKVQHVQPGGRCSFVARSGIVADQNSMSRLGSGGANATLQQGSHTSTGLSHLYRALIPLQGSHASKGLSCLYRALSISLALLSKLLYISSQQTCFPLFFNLS